MGGPALLALDGVNRGAWGMIGCRPSHGRATQIVAGIAIYVAATASASADPAARISGDARFSDDFEPAIRAVSTLGSSPFALGIDYSNGGGTERLIGGLGWSATDNLTFVLSGQKVDQTAAQALGVPSTERIATWSASAAAYFQMAQRARLTTHIDAWSAGPQTFLASTPGQTEFLGASGFRLAPGADFAVSDRVTVGFEAGYESAHNGISGFFGEIDLRAALDRFQLELNAWTSPNFGNGAQLTGGWQIGDRQTIAAYGGYTNGAAFGGVKFTVALGAVAGTRSAALVEDLDRHITRMKLKLPGMPSSARAAAIASTPTFNLFQDVDGNVCPLASAPTPGCTFKVGSGDRITVADDPDYDRFGFGADDLWYVLVDSVGNAYVYDQTSTYQETKNVSDFAGYFGGTSIGVGTSGTLWENVAGGTYWIGANGVLYSANGSAPNFRQAIN